MINNYVPTTEERQNAATSSENLLLSGDGVFATLQGEGVTAGQPSVFVRLQNCNLHCGRDGIGWQCDAWYTWDRTTREYWQEQRQVSVGELEAEIRAKWDRKFSPSEPGRLVLTGGEPLLQQSKLIDLAGRFTDWAIEIETNGTIAPQSELERAQFNCSPKLASSGNKLKSRYRVGVLNRIAALPNSWFKFVITNDDDIKEVKEVVDQTEISYDQVLLMSEGVEPEVLTARDDRLLEIASEIGCRVTARNQIFWFGNTRAT